MQEEIVKLESEINNLSIYIEQNKIDKSMKKYKKLNKKINNLSSNLKNLNEFFYDGKDENKCVIKDENENEDTIINNLMSIKNTYDTNNITIEDEIALYHQMIRELDVLNKILDDKKINIINV
jgi:paraquat-inducible protein B